MHPKYSTVSYGVHFLEIRAIYIFNIEISL